MTREQNPLFNQTPRILRETQESSTYQGDAFKAKVPSAQMRILKLASAELPFEPSWIKEERKKLVDRGVWNIAARMYRDPHPHMKPAIRHVLERFGISYKEDGHMPYVVFSDGGSDEIIERIITKLIWSPHVKAGRIVGIGPQFPEILEFAKGFGYSPVNPDSFKDWYKRFQNGQENIYQPYDMTLPYSSIVFPFRERRTLKEGIDKAIELRGNGINDEMVLYYICNPNTPTGGFAWSEDIQKLLLATAEHGDLVVIDEANAKAIQDSESAIQFTTSFSNLIVLRSLKAFIPGERIGYAVMSEEIGRRYHNVRRKFDIKTPYQLLLNKILRPDRLVPYLDEIRRETMALNAQFRNGLRRNGIEYYPGPHPAVPFTLVNLNHQTLLDQFLMETVPVLEFAETQPDFIFETDQQDWVRMRTPETERDIREAIHRIRISKQAANGSLRASLEWGHKDLNS